jgi:hypothetical protein
MCKLTAQRQNRQPSISQLLSALGESEYARPRSTQRRTQCVAVQPSNAGSFSNGFSPPLAVRIERDAILRIEDIQAALRRRAILVSR